MDVLHIQSEVAAALREGRPVVALESTLLAHGLPAEHRASVAAQLERVVREEGAVPATIAVFDGQLQVGLSEAGLARIIGSGVEKASLRDLAFALSRPKDTFATTVATTMFIAAKAGIHFFATGGIGGVHRGASESFDESADLRALSECPVLVVSAGAKAVLDLPKTLERLETLGVPVVGYKTNELPAFYSVSSGLPLSVRSDSEEELARAFDHHRALFGGGFLVVQPPPAKVAWPRSEIDGLIQEALETSEKEGITGARVTPFLLSWMACATEDRIVETNVALVVENARLAARIAKAEAELTKHAGREF